MQTYFKTYFCGAMAITAAIGSAPAIAQNTPSKIDDSPWRIVVGLGVASNVEYEGGSKRVSGLVPLLDLSYKTQGFGTFAVGAKERGFSWTVVDRDDLSFGVSLGAGTSRVDNKDGTLFRPGSKRLKGMGEISAQPEIGVFGHAVIGIPLIVEYSKGLGNGKQDLKTLKYNGHGGSRLTLSTELPIKIDDALSFSVSPNLVWADKKFTQAYFGVNAVQAAASGYQLFNASGGIKSIGLNLGARYKFDKNWSAQARLGIDQLRGDAGKSPLTQKKVQTSAVVGVSYEF
jgi:MipA family protein